MYIPALLYRIFGTPRKIPRDDAPLLSKLGVQMNNNFVLGHAPIGVRYAMVDIDILWHCHVG